MPLYVGDYLGDTGHLTTVQHGAYLLLMMHYWRQGELPEDEKQLAAITKLSSRAWHDCRATIQAFFYDGWKHKRIDEELSKMERATGRRAAAGQKGGMRSAMNRMLLEDAAGRSIARPLLQQRVATATLDHSHSHIETTSTVYEDTAAKGSANGRISTVSPELAALIARKR
jgi:uncharacterized protein YdaU (DUF1376 family)